MKIKQFLKSAFLAFILLVVLWEQVRLFALYYAFVNKLETFTVHLLVMCAINYMGYSALFVFWKYIFDLYGGAPWILRKEREVTK